MIDTENHPTTPEMEVLDAEHVFLLMKKEYRISRNIRAEWYFSQLNNTITVQPKESLGDYQGELEVVSVLPKRIPEAWDVSKPYKYKVTPSTIVTFMSRKYRLVFALDLSPSVASVDIQLGHVLFDEVLLTLKKCMLGLTQPFYIPGSKFLFAPQLFITIIAHTPFVTSKAQQVLTQGCLVTSDNVVSFLDQIKRQLEEFENCVAETAASAFDRSPLPKAEQGLFDDIFDRTSYDNQSHAPMVTPDAGMVNMLRYGILALQLLPENSSAGIIVITDGVTGLPDAFLLDSLLTQLRNSTIACSFLQIGNGYHVHSPLGFVPYTDLMQFIATATFGAFLATCPFFDCNSQAMNTYHRAFFAWSFQRGLYGFKLDQHRPQQLQPPTNIMSLSNPGFNAGEGGSLMRKKYYENNIHTSLSSLLSVRLRQGYTIKDTAITKGDSQIEVRLVLPWKHSVNIEYLVVSPWPPNNKRSIHIEVTIEGNYEFLHDVTCPKKPFKSIYRTIVVKNYSQMLKSLAQTDQLLVHLQSFATNLAFYTVPESIKNGVPLFYLPPNSITPVLCSKDSTLSQFASFWKPICMLDINIWQKWMHTHRIGILLEHDMPLPRYLHLPNSNGRFNIIQCRQALTSLNVLLRDWSTFVLMENHSYIKLLFSEAEGPPISFYIIRVTSKPPCMVLRLAFLGGTPGHERNEVVNQLREKILSLNFPQRATLKDNLPHKQARKKPQIKADVIKIHRPPLQRIWSEINCCVLLTKPVEKILIRYEKLPLDFVALPFCHDGHLTKAVFPLTTNKKASSMFSVLSRYLHHQRWVWAVQSSATSSINLQVVGRILNTLTKMRLQEGFNFAYTNSGIINMVVEVEMKNPDNSIVSSLPDEPDENEDNLFGCVVQYILFPPHTITSLKDSVSEDDLDETETNENEGELQIITECWIEPQYGVVINSTPERQHFDGHNYKNLAKAMFPVDLECISTMITFEHLILMCQCISVPLPMSTHLTASPSFSGIQPLLQLPQTSCGTNVSEKSVYHIPFAFDLMRLLPKCQQAELLLSTFIQNQSHDTQQTAEHEMNFNKDLSNQLLFELFFEDLARSHDREISLSDQDNQMFPLLISQRERDLVTHPLPFDITQFIKEPSTARPSPVRRKILLENPYERQISNWTLTSEGSGSYSSREIEHKDESKETGKYDGKLTYAPRWRCFMKSISPTHLILTILPASYSELKLLMVKDENESNSKSSTDNKNTSEIHLIKPSSSLSTNSTIPESVLSDDTAPLDKVDELTTSSSEIKTEDENYTEQFENDDDVDDDEEKYDYLPYNLPIYLYDCPMSGLITDLINKGSEGRPKDIFQDLTYGVDNEQEVDDTATVRSDNTDTYKSGENSKQPSPEFRADDGDMKQEKSQLRQHCNLVENSYSKCFVMGIFRSLQMNCPVMAHDVESAMDICMESFQEIDISNFLKTICGHIKEFTDKKKAEKNSKDLSPQSKPSTPKDLLELTTISFRVPELSPTKKGALRFPLSALQSDYPCSTLEDLHLLIKAKFADILKKAFKPIPSKPEFFFFCPASMQTPADNQTDLDREDETTDFCSEEEANMPADTESANEVFADDYVSSTNRAGSFDCQRSNLDSASIGSYADQNEASTGDYDEEMPPLFVQLICSVRLKNSSGQAVGNSVGNCVVQSLPTCLNEVIECVENTGNEIDLVDLQITMDILCLTLSLDILVPYTVGTQHSDRTISLCSGGISPPQGDLSQRAKEDIVSLSSVEEEQMLYNGKSTDVCPEITSQINHSSLSESKFVTETIADQLGHLPDFQHQFVSSCVEQINWLLRDEIASAMRSSLTITHSILDMVASHVEDSQDKPACITEMVPLQFVFGSDQSLAKFMQEFVRMRLPGYRLYEEEDFYYLVLDRALSQCGRSDSMNRPSSSALSSKDFIIQSSSHATDQIELLQRIGEIPCHTSTQREFDGNFEEWSKTKAERNKRRKETFPEDKSPFERKGLKQNYQIDAVAAAKEIVGDNDVAGKDDDDIANDPDDNTQPEDDDNDTSGSSIQVLEEGDEHMMIAENLENKNSVNIERSVTSLDAHKLPDTLPENVLDLELSSPKDIHVTDEADAKTIISPEDLSEVKEIVNKPCIVVTDDLRKDESPKKSKALASLHLMEGEVFKKSASSASLQLFEDGNGIQNLTPPSIRKTASWANFSQRKSKKTTPVSASSLCSGMSSLGSVHGSFNEEVGYDGGSSDSEVESVCMFLNDSDTQRPLLPDFWLILKVFKDRVNVYFHARDTGESGREELERLKDLYKQVVHNIKDICKLVNQSLLLQDLHDTRMCNHLLEPEGSDDTWKHDEPSGLSIHYLRRLKSMDESESDMANEYYNRGYLEAAMKCKPGTFACPSVWVTYFTLHPRLKIGPNRTGMSRGIQALRLVLNTFSVNNRKNMFVYQERSGAVFYLRLHDTVCLESSTSFINGEHFHIHKNEENSSFSGGSRSSSVWSLPSKKGPQDTEDTVHSEVRKLSGSETIDSVSLSSRLSQKKFEDSVMLCVHGIREAGPEIKEDLVQVLQNRLDEAVLDIISVMLARNPMCKLMVEDVQFIQHPQEQPKATLLFTLPCFALQHLYAVGHYLRQNLLQFLHKPRYVDNKAENHFQDYSTRSDISSPLNEDDVFIYNRPHSSGGKGMGCIAFAIVDGQGNLVQLLSSTKPSAIAYKDGLQPEDFEALTKTSLYQGSTSSCKPGPFALVQLRVWERGNVHLDILTDKLMQAIQHALADLVTEFCLLTAPLAEISQSPLIITEPPSEVSTPVLKQPPGIVEAHQLKKVLESSTTLKARASSPFAFMSPLDSPGVISLPDTSQKTSELYSSSDSETNKRKDDELWPQHQRYESGERGMLHHIYSSLVPIWFEFNFKLGVTSIKKTEAQIPTRHSVTPILRDFQVWVGSIASDTTSKVFRQSSSNDNKVIYIPVHPLRPLIMTPDTTKSDNDTMRSHNSLLPGNKSNYIMIGRNQKQWKASLAYGEEEDGNSDLPSLVNPKTHKGFQKFAPLLPNSLDVHVHGSHDGSSSALNTPTTTSAPVSPSIYSPSIYSPPPTISAMVPRQRLLLMTIQDKELCLYTYNWAQDLNSLLERILTRLMHWHHTRVQLLHCIIGQKIGLFRHHNFSEQRRRPTWDSYNYSGEDVDTLIQQTAPPMKDLQMGGAKVSSHNSSHIHASLQLIDEVLRDARPSKPMHKSSHQALKDPVTRHGKQLQEVRSIERKDAEKRRKLENLYMMWQQRGAHSSVHITEELLDLVKQSARLFHYCQTPLLFCPYWRCQLPTADVQIEHRFCPTPPIPVQSIAPELKSRSRHSSAGSVKGTEASGRRISLVLTRDNLAKETRDSPETPPRKTHTEELEQVLIRSNFVQEYIQYLQSLGYVSVVFRPPSPKRSFKNVRLREESKEKRTSKVKPVPDFYLQKCILGGIILLELTYNEPFFCIKMYTWACTVSARAKNSQVHLLDECDKIKVFSHLHSFAYDFHLRSIHLHISGRQIFKHGYHLTNFLDDFLKYYRKFPSFSRNLINSGTVTVPSGSVVAHKLYMYMLDHHELYDMKIFKMLPCTLEVDAELDAEHVLVSLSACKATYQDHNDHLQIDEFDISLLITLGSQPFQHQNEHEQHILSLKFYVILTKCKDYFPKMTMEQRFGTFKTVSQLQVSVLKQLLNPPYTPLLTREHKFFSSDNFAVDLPKLERSWSMGSQNSNRSLRAERSGSMGSLERSQDSYKPRSKSGSQIAKSQVPVGICQESVNYLSYFSYHEMTMQQILEEQTKLAKTRIENMIAKAMVHCKRDYLWNRMLGGDEGTPATVKKQTTKEGIGVAKLTFDDVEQLIESVTRIPLHEFDPSLRIFYNLHCNWYTSLSRVLVNKYNDCHRMFSATDSSKHFMVVLNPNNLDTMMLITVYVISNKFDIDVVFREPVPDLDLHNLWEKQSYHLVALQQFIEDFVNAMCFHLWSHIL